MQGVREEGRAWEAAWERPGKEDPAQGSQLPHRSLWLGDSGAGGGGCRLCRSLGEPPRNPVWGLTHLS